MQLTLVVADFFPQEQSLAASAGQLPPLPGLATILRYGRHERGGEAWRGWLAQAFGRPDLAAIAPAQVAAAAPGVNAPIAHAWFASPVHLLAGIDHLRLHTAGLLQLQPAEGARLAADFAAAFVATGQRLVPLCGGFLLAGLQVPHATLATDRDPARWLGANIAPAQVGVAPVVRSITAELEMWLHEHAVNRQRAMSGQLAVNSLWLWGGDAPPAPETQGGPAVVVPMNTPRVYGGDGFVAGLCARSGLPPPETAQTFAQLADQRAGSVLVVVSAAASGARDAPLLRIERDWLMPGLAALRAGAVSQLSVHLGARLVTLRRTALRRFWRRARPWWQGLFQG